MLTMSRPTRSICCLLLIGCASACATPAQRFDQRADALGYRKVVVQGAGYTHVAYLNSRRTAGGSTLHVYLEGDGAPWLRRRVAAVDPTSDKPLMLDLMALDPDHSVYLGRPCYQGIHGADSCTPDLWTDGRYSETVVASMAAAADRLSADYGALVLLGHSGGGTLAMLMAERLPKTAAVVTVAANLDTGRWADLHAQPPLSASLNPAARAPLSPRIRQLHVAGGRDDNVPPVLVREAIRGQPGAGFKLYPEHGHDCCWNVVWPEILGAANAARP